MWRMPSTAIEPLFVATELALDFLNTVVRVEGELRDVLQTDGDVRRWLELAGVIAEGDALPPYRPQALRRAARELREILRVLVDQRKAARRIDPAPLNAFLAQGRQGTELVQERSGEVRLQRRFGRATPEQLLMPLALSGSELLATGNFDLVRICESEECVLYFYDRTKSHRRRWCSMKTCGNRHKVANFRERNSER